MKGKTITIYGKDGSKTELAQAEVSPPQLALTVPPRPIGWYWASRNYTAEEFMAQATAERENQAMASAIIDSVPVTPRDIRNMDDFARDLLANALVCDGLPPDMAIVASQTQVRQAAQGLHLDDLTPERIGDMLHSQPRVGDNGLTLERLAEAYRQMRAVWSAQPDERPRHMSPVWMNLPEPQPAAEPAGVQVPSDMLHFDRPSTTHNFSKLFWVDQDGKCRLAGTLPDLQENIKCRSIAMATPRPNAGRRPQPYHP